MKVNRSISGEDQKTDPEQYNECTQHCVPCLIGRPLVPLQFHEVLNSAPQCI